MLRNARIFISEDVVLQGECIVRRVSEVGCVLVQQRTLAQCIVVNDPANPGSRSLWAACLLGQSIISCRMFLTGNGPAVQMCAALKTPRQLFVSPGCRTAHPRVSELLTKVVGRPWAAWTMLPAPRPGCLTLVSDSADDGSRSAMGVTRFLALCHKPAATTSGVCGV